MIRSTEPRPWARPRPRKVMVVVAIVIAAAVPSAHGEPAPLPDDFRRPVETPVRVLTPFDPPEHPWSRGHRGVDLASAPLGRVLAPADGLVHFAGPVAGRPVLSVDHGDGLRTTYEPVRAVVGQGDEVHAGQLLGHVIAGHSSCPGAVCLHWGARVTSGSAAGDDDYVDPMALLNLDDRTIRLKPLQPGDAVA